jgi:hypothetical protein
VLPSLPLPPGGRDDAKVAAALRAAMAGLLARHAAELRAAAVAVWEARFRGPGREAAWRVVVSLPTGERGGEGRREQSHPAKGMPCDDHVRTTIVAQRLMHGCAVQSVNGSCSESSMHG